VQKPTPVKIIAWPIWGQNETYIFCPTCSKIILTPLWQFQKTLTRC